MAARHIQTQNNTAATVTTISVSSVNLTKGSGVVVTMMFNTNKVAVGTITQSAGDTLTQLASEIDNSGQYTVQFVNYSVAGGSTTFTLAWTGGTNTTIFLTEVAGLLASGFDKTANTVSSASATKSSGTTAAISQAYEFAVAAWHMDSSGSTTLTSLTNGFTCPTNGQLLGSPTGVHGMIAYLSTDTIAAVETTETTAGAQTCTGLIGTFKASVNPVVGTPENTIRYLHVGDGMSRSELAS